MKNALTITTLGNLSISHKSEIISNIPTLKAEALLIYLAIENRGPIRRDRLSTLLWPGMPEKSARHNLSQILYSIRQTIPDVPSMDGDKSTNLLLADRQSIQKNPDALIEVDVHRLDDLIKSTQIHDHLSLESCETCTQALKQAVDLYTGDFLNDFYLDDSNDFEDWAGSIREAYRKKVLEILENLTEIFIQKNDYDSARAFADRQLTIDPLREVAYRQLMELLVKSGQRAEAVQKYHQWVRKLEIELGTDPAQETTALYKIIQGGDAQQSISHLQGGDIRGFEIREHLGSGHTGAVYKAYQPMIGRDVAIKVILQQFANHPDFIRRFEVEAQLVARLEHPHIVPLYDYWRDPSGAYLVMRWLKGGSLQTDLQRGGWKPRAALQLVEQITSALSLAHRQGVVHCDIKPANILLDEEGNAYLSDFGIATLTGPLAQLSQSLKWGYGDSSPRSLGYASPEIMRGLDTTPLADIYSLGVLLYKLLTGEHPFPGIEGEALVQKHLTETLPSVRSLRPELPEGVDAIIQQATTKDPRARFQDVESLAQAFRRALQPERTGLPEISLVKVISHNPYKGLRPFAEADARDFFGRDDLVARLLNRLSAGAGYLDPARFLAVVGPSGSGKSSVVKAGLIPAVRKGAIPGSEDWFVVEMTPGSDPLEELETALLRIAIEPPEDLMEQLAEDKCSLLRMLRRALPGFKSEILLVIDQFEELFTLVENETTRNHFLEMLALAVNDPHSPLRLVITLRADFYDRPLRHSEFGELMRETTEVVLPLNSEELGRAICGPLELVGVGLEATLMARIVQDVGDQPGTLPLLQYALTETFEHREGDRLTLEAYEASGGVLGALGRRAEEIYHHLDETEQDMTRQLFLRLVTLGEGIEDTRRRVLKSELESVSGDPLPVFNDLSSVIHEPSSVIGPVIDKYGRYRLLTFDRDPATRAPTVEVAHEALLREWPRLRGWLDESRGDIRMQRILGAAAQEWEDSDRDAGFLLRGARLDQFSPWVDDASVALTAQERAFLAASLEKQRERKATEAQRQAHEARLEQRARKILRALVTVLAIAAVIALILSGVAFRQRQEARRQASVGLAAQAMSEIQGTDPERSVLLALEALENYPYTWQAEHALGQSILDNRLRQVLIHEGFINSAEWSADGRKILTASSNGAIHLWDVSTGEKLLHITKGAPTIASWSPDEKYILAVNGDKTQLKIWDAETGEERLYLDRDDLGGQLNITLELWRPWSPDGDHFLTLNLSGTLKIWDAQSGKATRVLSPHPDAVTQAAQDSEQTDIDSLLHLFRGEIQDQALWSPDGEFIAAASLVNNRVTIWQMDTGEALHDLPGEFEDQRVSIAGWSPSGDRIATRGLGGVKIYDTASGDLLSTLPVPGVYVYRALWSPDGERILSMGIDDGTARLWDASKGLEVNQISNLGSSTGLGWSASGDLIAFGDTDGIVHIWDTVRSLEKIKLYGNKPRIIRIAFSPDGERILVVGDENVVNIYDLFEATLRFSFPGGPDSFGGGSIWSPDGRQIAGAHGAFPEVKIWDASSGEELIRLYGHEAPIWSLFWSPSGDLIASTGDDQTIRIWDAETGEQKLVFSKHTDITNSAIWSPDSSQIASSDLSSGKAIIWNPLTGEERLTFSAIPGLVTMNAWSPDGNRILSTGAQGKALIWDSTTGDVLLDLFPQNFELDILPGDWTKDGKRVLVQSSDGVIHIFDATNGKELYQFPTHQGAWNFLALSPSGQRLLKGGDGGARVYDVQTGAELFHYPVLGWTDITYSPDGSQILVGSNYGTFEVYPAWHSVEELIAYAKSCCVLRELTPEERAQFGLPPLRE